MSENKVNAELVIQELQQELASKTLENAILKARLAEQAKPKKEVKK